MTARHKHGAIRTVVDGITFPSKLEAKRYGELKLLMKAGLISKLEMQPSFVLAPSVVLGGRKKPPLRYVADYRYVDTATGLSVVEDCKGQVLPMYRAKAHLMKHLYNIDIVEVRR